MGTSDNIFDKMGNFNKIKILNKRFNSSFFL